jgi:hypothetical protein
MRFKDFIVSMLSDAEGTGISSKRVIGFVSFLIFIALTFINTYSGKITPSVFVDGLMYIILGTFLGGTLEYFSKRQTSTTVRDNDNVIVNVPSVTPTTTKKPIVDVSTTTTTTNKPTVEDEDFIVDNNTE